MTFFETLYKHLQTHKYKRGRFEGDAPLERRGATHKRVRYNSRDDTMEVYVYRSVLVSAARDGTFRLFNRGWSTQVTRDALSVALHMYARTQHATFRLSVGATTHRGVSQWVLYTSAGTFCFYDGVQVAASGTPLEPVPFKRRAINRERSSAFSKDPTIKEFFHTLPVLHAALPDSRPVHLSRGYSLYAGSLREALQDPVNWPLIVEVFGYHQKWQLSHKIDDPRTVARDIRTSAKGDMYETIDTDYVTLPPVLPRAAPAHTTTI